MIKKYTISLLAVVFTLGLIPHASAGNVLINSDEGAVKQLVVAWVKYQNNADEKGMKSILLNKRKATWDPGKEKQALEKARAGHGPLKVARFYEVTVDTDVAVVTVDIMETKKKVVSKLDVLAMFEDGKWKFAGMNDDPLSVEFIPAPLKIDHYFKSNKVTVKSALASFFGSLA